MFLEKNPELSNTLNNESNINIEIIDQKLGQFELPFSIQNELNITPNMCFAYSLENIEGVYKLHVKQINPEESKIKILLPLTNINNNYSIYVPHRLDYLEKDTKYFNICGIIKKCDYTPKRYIFQLHLYLNKSSIDEIYIGITKQNILYMNVKDILTFVFTSGYYHNSLNHKIKIENIKNEKTGMYVLTKEYKVQPYNYQLENILWCKNIENHTNDISSIQLLNGYDDKIKLDSYYLLNDNILYLYGKSIITPDEFKTMKYFYHIQGGLLCDNTGLGKTLTLSVHITDDNTNINNTIANRINILNKYKSDLENPTSEDIMINKIELLNILNIELSLLQDDKFKLKSTCNLLIVPVRLLQQWDTEIKSYLPETKVFLINTIRDFFKLKLEDINKYNIIIISITFLQNDRRSSHPEGYDITDILWKRVIVDEVHELFNQDANSKRNFTVVNKLKALYKWGISATPSLNLNCDDILSFLTNDNFWSNKDIISYNRYSRVTTDVAEFKTFLNRYYRYNELKKVNTEIHIPDYEENIVELEMSNIEKLMYNNATGDTKRMIALCTNYKISSQDSQLSGFATVSELKQRMLEQHTKKKNEHIEKIEQENKIIGYIKELIDWLYTDRTSMPEHIKINYCIITGNYDAYNIMTKDVNLLNDEIERVSKKLESKEKQIDILKKDLKLIEAKEKMIDKFNEMIEEKLAEPCMICFGNLDTVMITTCNHMYCGMCVNELFKNTPSIKCPMCRNPLTRLEVNSMVDKNLNLISGDDMKKKLETKEEENVNISSGGTKINAIINYIKENSKSKIIIFATEIQTLNLLNDSFIENKVKFVNLKGNAFVVSKQLKRFKTGEEQVILLSADRANSGTNLIEASHIILLDTHLISNIRDKKNIEKQAIGRAVRLGQKNNVKVVRFIMKNTIEQVHLNKMS
jgi:SNF2 family DNA or RNA helicase